MPTYGQSPSDVVTDSRGNALAGRPLRMFATRLLALGNQEPLGETETDERGRWSFDTDSADLWARLPDGTVWRVSGPASGGGTEGLAAHVAATTDVHGIADTGALVDTADPRLSDARTPTAHTHAQSEVTGLDAALAGKASTTHSHPTSEVTGLDVALDGKASTVHTHATADVTGLDTALDGKAPASHSHAQSDVTGLTADLAAKAPLSHTHASTDVSDSTVVGRSLLTAADAAAARTAIGAGTSSLVLGTTGTTAKAGDYTPAWTEVTGKPATFTPSAHGHATADVTGLDTALAGKAATSHTHVATTDLTATGTKDATTFLRGDNTWGVPTFTPTAPVYGVTGRTYNLRAGILRNDGTGWALLDDTGHRPANMGAVTVMSDRVRVAFPASTKLASVSAACDETFASMGLRVGTSVGLDYVDVMIYVEPWDRITDYVSYTSGTGWASLNGVFTGLSYSSGVLTLTHEAMGTDKHSGVALANRGSHGALVGGYTNTTTQVAFYTGSFGSLTASGTPSSSTTHRVHVTRFGRRASTPAVDPTTIVSSTGNIWLQGFVE